MNRILYKKDFQIIAEIVGKVENKAQITEGLVKYLGTKNESFKPDRFREAVQIAEINGRKA